MKSIFLKYMKCRK